MSVRIALLRGVVSFSFCMKFWFFQPTSIPSMPVTSSLAKFFFSPLSLVFSHSFAVFLFVPSSFTLILPCYCPFTPSNLYHLLFSLQLSLTRYLSISSLSPFVCHTAYPFSLLLQPLLHFLHLSCSYSSLPISSARLFPSSRFQPALLQKCECRSINAFWGKRLLNFSAGCVCVLVYTTW